LNSAAAATPAIYGAAQTGALVYVKAVAGSTPAGQTANVTAPGYYYFDGLRWQSLLKASALPAAWLLAGNANTNPANNFLGTTDQQPLVFKVGSARAGYISTGNDNNGDNFTAIGLGALVNNVASTVTGLPSQNNAFGYNALRANTTGRNNNAVGSYALYNNTTGNYNSAVGNYALYSNIAGSNNSAFGSNALFSNRGSFNVGMGYMALSANTTGSNNVGVGYRPLYNNTTGIFNVAIGSNALNNGDNISYNTAIGYDAWAGATTGDFNVALGAVAGNDQKSGSHNIVIGSLNGTSTATRVNLPDLNGSNQLNIGNVIYGTNIYDPVNVKIGIGTDAPGATLAVKGSQSVNVRVLTVISNAYVVTATDYCVVAPGGSTITLPAATVAGREVVIRATLAGTLTVKAAGTDVIDNGASATTPDISVSGSGVRLISNAGIWYVMP
jgi:hypothetical protein